MKLENIGMPEIEDMWAFPHRRGNPSSDIKSGASVSHEITNQITPHITPDLASMSIRTALYLAESPELPNHFNSQQAIDALVRGMRQALVTQPTEKAIQAEREFNQGYPKVINISIVSGYPQHKPRFMTLGDVREAASRKLLAAAH